MSSVPSVASTPKAVEVKKEHKVAPQQSEQVASYRGIKELPAVNRMEHSQLEAKKSTEEQTKDQEQQVIKAIEKANKHIKTFDRKLEFSIHEATKQIMVKVIDTEDDTTIREIPSEKILDMVANLWEMAGILVDEKR